MQHNPFKLRDVEDPYNSCKLKRTENKFRPKRQSERERESQQKNRKKEADIQASDPESDAWIDNSFFLMLALEQAS